MLKYSVAIAALLLGAPVAFAQGAGDTGKTGGGAGMSSSGPSSSGPSSSGSSSSGLKSGGGSAERSGASSGASEGASGSESSASDLAPGHKKEGGSAKENAPGQTKSEGSARDNAPGHRKDSSDQRSENKSKNFDRITRTVTVPTGARRARTAMPKTIRTRIAQTARQPTIATSRIAMQKAIATATGMKPVRKTTMAHRQGPAKAPKADPVAAEVRSPA